MVPGAGGLYMPPMPAGGPRTLPPPLPAAVTAPGQGQPVVAPATQAGGAAIDVNGSTPTNFVSPPRDPGMTQAAYQQSVSDARAAWEASPAVKAAQASATKTADVTGGEAGEALKLYNKMSASLGMISDRFDKMRAATNDASSGFSEMTGVGPALANAGMFPGAQKTADANAMLEQAGSQQILGELGPMLAQSGARANKFLEQISASASGYNKAAPPQTKQLIINGLEDNYLATLKANADEARAAGQPVPPAAEIDAQIAAIKARRPVLAETQPAAQVYTPGQILDSPTMGKVVFKGGDPTDKSNYIAVGK